MNSITLNFSSLVFTLVFLTSASCFAEALQTGEKMTPFSLQDQFEKQHNISKETKLILFTKNKDMGDVIDDAFKEKPKSYFLDHGIQYIADISKMPGLIARWVAIPAMKEKNYPIMLDKTGDIKNFLPYQEQSISLIYLENLNITTIQYIKGLKELTAALPK